ncbi:MAG: hypothetical protein ACRCTI_15795, partial [Beijerinckiaceae bacterium]
MTLGGVVALTGGVLAIGLGLVVLRLTQLLKAVETQAEGKVDPAEGGEALERREAAADAATAPDAAVASPAVIGAAVVGASAIGLAAGTAHATIVRPEAGETPDGGQFEHRPNPDAEGAIETEALTPENAPQAAAAIPRAVWLPGFLRRKEADPPPQPKTPPETATAEQPDMPDATAGLASDVADGASGEIDFLLQEPNLQEPDLNLIAEKAGEVQPMSEEGDDHAVADVDQETPAAASASGVRT